MLPVFLALVWTPSDKSSGPLWLGPGTGLRQGLTTGATTLPAIGADGLTAQVITPVKLDVTPAKLEQLPAQAVGILILLGSGAGHGTMNCAKLASLVREVHRFGLST